MNNYKKQKILSFNINIISTQQLINQVKNFLILKKGHYISISNVHQCIEAHDNKDFAEVINNADLAIPDGRPIYWALKLLKHKENCKECPDLNQPGFSENCIRYKFTEEEIGYICDKSCKAWKGATITVE